MFLYFKNVGSLHTKFIHVDKVHQVRLYNKWSSINHDSLERDVTRILEVRYDNTKIEVDYYNFDTILKDFNNIMKKIKQNYSVVTDFDKDYIFLKFSREDNHMLISKNTIIEGMVSSDYVELTTSDTTKESGKFNIYAIKFTGDNSDDDIIRQTLENL